MRADDYRGYPSVRCDDCGSSTNAIVRPVDPSREFGVGEWAVYQCECGHGFEAIVPEPPDRYEGDGVFAENH